VKSLFVGEGIMILRTGSGDAGFCVAGVRRFTVRRFTFGCVGDDA